jgi:alkanesulfonate monooxygenase SsuD/methylene tetrahydromethanopterin reductase-like flavin-dependent oxidoreductase (luciferase family)
MTLRRGFGISALVDKSLIAPLASAAEAAGYATFWVNDVPGANGLEQLQRAQAATNSIRLGVGVLPVDRWPGEQIVREVRRLNLDTERLAIGIGAGALHKGSLEATANVAGHLTDTLPVKVLIGALGPQMCQLAGASADGVILNWLTAQAATGLAARTRAGASESGKASTEVVAYVRTAANPAAQARLAAESAAYESYPAYARHFERIGSSALDTTVNGASGDIDYCFRGFAPAVDEVVARAIARGDSLADYLEVLNGAAPAARIGS